jgi:hypothetical protein
MRLVRLQGCPIGQIGVTQICNLLEGSRQDENQISIHLESVFIPNSKGVTPIDIDEALIRICAAAGIRCMDLILAFNRFTKVKNWTDALGKIKETKLRRLVFPLDNPDQVEECRTTKMMSETVHTLFKTNAVLEYLHFEYSGTYWRDILKPLLLDDVLKGACTQRFVQHPYPGVVFTRLNKNGGKK